MDTAGNVLGHHQGYERFTIGQRKGLGVTFGSPRYVVKIDQAAKQVVIGTYDELGRCSLFADRLNWLVPTVDDQFSCLAKIRYRHTPVPACVERRGDDEIEVRFEEPVFGIAPGQAVVLYDDIRVLGGGWIRAAV